MGSGGALRVCWSGPRTSSLRNLLGVLLPPSHFPFVHSNIKSPSLPLSRTTIDTHFSHSLTHSLSLSLNPTGHREPPPTVSPVLTPEQSPPFTADHHLVQRLQRSLVSRTGAMLMAEDGNGVPRGCGGDAVVRW
ncbi:hypothetical protein LR48_Vigan853s000400 [Vigna angularis]|uniref:Uncharacterized protein n=1 Tax=Phaseolus angularis TaxID=3914 RepID=A0A0L9THY5_PHAAN|nr:hypothetical protein LR48_Vigan853s000400 [Vigna angularis]